MYIYICVYIYTHVYVYIYIWGIWIILYLSTPGWLCLLLTSSPFENPWIDGALPRRAKDHINIKISHSGSAQYKGDTRNTVWWDPHVSILYYTILYIILYYNYHIPYYTILVYYNYHVPYYTILVYYNYHIPYYTILVYYNYHIPYYTILVYYNYHIPYYTILGSFGLCGRFGPYCQAAGGFSFEVPRLATRAAR